MAQKALNLEDIVAGNIIQTKGIGSMTWLKDGERYSRLENNKQTGGTDIVAYRAKDNSREVIIPSSLLTDVLIRESFIMRHRDGPVMIQMRQSV